MSDFKNPRLMLAGAAIGAFTQDPENHPITGMAGMGIGAYIGGNLEIVKTEGKRVFQKKAEPKPVTLSDNIAVDLNDLNASRQTNFDKLTMSDILEFRKRDTTKRAKKIQRSSYASFRSKFYDNVKGEGNQRRLFKLKTSLKFDEIVNTLEKGQYDHVNTFKKLFTKIHKSVNNSDIKDRMTEIQNLRAEAEASRKSMVSSYENAVRQNFKTVFGADIDTVIRPDLAKYLILGNMYDGNMKVDDLENAIKKLDVDNKVKTAMLASVKPGSISFDESTNSYKPTLQALDLSKVSQYESASTQGLSIGRDASKEEKVQLISKYLKENLGNEDGEADRIAKNIAEYTDQAKINIAGGQIEITQPGQSTAKFNLSQRINGHEVERINGNTYTPIKTNILMSAQKGATMPGGKPIYTYEKGLSTGGIASENKVVNEAVKQSGFSQVETGLFHSWITGEPLKKQEERYKKSAYVASNESFDRLEIAPRDPAIDITNQAKTAKGSPNLINVSDSLSFEEFSKIETDINENRIAMGLPTLPPGKIRSQSNHVDTIEHGLKITSSMVPNPHRSAGVMNRGNKLMIVPSVSSRTRDGHINDIWRRASEELAKEGKGGSLVGSMLATVGTLPNSFNASVANSAFGLSVGDGQTITTMHGYSSATPKTIDLGSMSSFTGTPEQIERMNKLISGEAVHFAKGEELGVIDGQRFVMPKEFDSIHGLKLEQKDGSYKIHAIGYTDISRKNNAVGTKIFGELKSNAVSANPLDISNQLNIGALEELGILRASKGRIYIAGTNEEAIQNAKVNAYTDPIENARHKEILRTMLQTSLSSLRDPRNGTPSRPNLSLTSMDADDWRNLISDFQLRVSKMRSASTDELDKRILEKIELDFLSTRSAGNKNIYARSEDAKAVSTLEALDINIPDVHKLAGVSIYNTAYTEDDIKAGLSNLSGSIEEILTKSKDADKNPVYDKASRTTTNSSGNYAAVDLLDIMKSAESSTPEIGRLSELSNKAKAIYLAERAINDDKASNLAYATYMRNLMVKNESLVNGVYEFDSSGNRVKISPDHYNIRIRGGNADGSDAVIRLGRNTDGTAVSTVDVVKQAARAISTRTQLFSRGNTKGGIAPDVMYRHLKDDFDELFQGLRGLKIESDIATLATIQSGNEYITGANANKATISWMAQKAFHMNDMGPDIINSMTYRNNDAAYELRSRTLQRNAGQDITEAFGEDIQEAKAIVQNMFSPDAVDRMAIAKGTAPNLKQVDGIANINLLVPEDVSPDRFGPIKSVSIPLVNTDLSGVVTLDDGTSSTIQIDKKKRQLLISMLNYQDALSNGGGKAYLESAKAAYLKAFDEWRELDAATEKNVAKSASKRQFHEGASVSAVATSGEQEKLRLIQFNDHKRNSVFINDETAKSLGFMNKDLYEFEDTGFNGIKRVVHKGTKDSVLGVSVREPASGPLSAMVTDMYLDTRMKGEGLAMAMGANFLSAQSGDLDGDKLTLGILLKSTQKYQEVRDSMNKAMGFQHSLMSDYGEFIKNINLKMKNMRDFYDDAKTIEGVSSIEGDKAAESMKKILSGSQRDFQAPEITAIQQLISESLAREHADSISKIMADSSLTAEMKAAQISDRTAITGLAFEASRVIQENILKSVRKATAGSSKGADTLLEILSDIRSGIKINPEAAHEKMGTAVKDWFLDMYKEDFKNMSSPDKDKMIKALDDVSDMLYQSIKKHGASINIDKSNFVGDIYQRSDKVIAGYSMVEKVTDRALQELAEGSEVLRETLETNKISPIEDAFSSIIDTIKANKKPLLFGGVGLAALAFVGGAEAPNTSSPMYNSPVARTNPTLPPLEDNKAYIGDNWGVGNGSVTINGRTIDGYTDSRIKQNVRSMFQGDSNARNTLRIQQQSY